MMEDLSTDWKLKKVYPDLAKRWLSVRLKIFKDFGKQIGVTEGLRTFSDQWSIWALGRKREIGGAWTIIDPSQVRTFAQPGFSLHQYGLGIDICFRGGDPYLLKLPKGDAIEFFNQYGLACKEQGLEWGGDWAKPKTDRPHCQITYGLSIHAIQILYEDQGIAGIWKKCDQAMKCGIKTK